MQMYVPENVGNGEPNDHNGQKHLPSARIIFAVGRTVFFIRPNQRNGKSRHEKNNERYLTLGKMHGAKVGEKMVIGD